MCTLWRSDFGCVLFFLSVNQKIWKQWKLTCHSLSNSTDMCRWMSFVKNMLNKIYGYAQWFSTCAFFGMRYALTWMRLCRARENSEILISWTGTPDSKIGSQLMPQSGHILNILAKGGNRRFHITQLLPLLSFSRYCYTKKSTHTLQQERLCTFEDVLFSITSTGALGQIPIRGQSRKLRNLRRDWETCNVVVMKRTSVDSEIASTSNARIDTYGFSFGGICPAHHWWIWYCRYKSIFKFQCFHFHSPPPLYVT